MHEPQAATILGTDGPLAADIRPRGSATPAGAILLTGATGYLGRHLLRQLLLQDERGIYGLARSSEAVALKSLLRKDRVRPRAVLELSRYRSLLRNKANLRLAAFA